MADPTRYSTNGSSNHSKSRPPPPRLRVPPGHVAFRMLCHASRIGGVIGKSGAIIKNLQQLTGAKIRVEDAPPDTSDRVVVIIAPSAISSKVYLGRPAERNGYGGSDAVGTVWPDVSKAQEALLKVFERVLDVAAETAGTEVRDGVVSCRLLADSPQVGSVIGKGGKVVEKIRKDTGCKIRALSSCVRDFMASDEMIEIEGNVSSVKKALLAVSHCLQDCTPADRTKMMDSKTYDSAVVIPHETLTDPHADHLLQRNSVISAASKSSNSFSSGLHSLSADFNRISSLDPQALQQEVTFRILFPSDKVGCVIGKGGSIVKALQNETGASIMVGPSVAHCEERVVTITASESHEARYSPAQKAVVLVFSKSVEAGSENGLDPGYNRGSSVTARILVPTNQVGCLLGKGGAIVSEMRKKTGTSIRVIGTDQVPKCASDNDQVVQISGVFSNVQDALYNATGRLRDNLFASTQNVASTRSTSSVFHDTGPYGRPVDCAPLGAQPGAGISHNQSKQTFSSSIDHPGVTRNLDCSPSPGLWTSQMASRGSDDVGRKLSSLNCGLELGSASKAAIVTSTTVEVVVPDHVFDSVYGEGGNNLTRLRQISGATVIVHEPRPGTKDKTIVMSGTPDQTQAAQSLLQAFILTGSS
ncbi:LOW QUALITY PROTEIN: KH domain-containing protein HEN4-like [Prosopis cineraria]|uniref:LOW QUALITY PROTEIN: KH domain-containing protein HEN4-like n=1 Tax=Prosopis cineraria TaxID=364024 RepID=UPI00240F94D8|nr:LOW QUALITY PROTEIN: KH domain-containing protein HEN4-like [Prosopis cineraria]